MNPAIRPTVEKAFERAIHSLAGETTEVGWEVLVQLVAGFVSTAADTPDEAATLIVGIATESTATMRANFDFYRETADQVGPRQ